MQRHLHLHLLLVLAACSSKSDPQNDPTVDAGLDAPPTEVDAPVAGTDPATDGPYTVTNSNASIPGAETGRTVPATVFVPSNPGPHPLVVISPGFQMDRAQYTSYAKHLATWGFVAILTDYADRGFFADHAKLAADVPKVIDWALPRPELAIAPSQIATAGHSLGGRISVFAATLDARIKAVVAWDPVDANSPSVAPEKMTSMTAALAVIGETTNASGGGMPCAPAADNFTQFYAAAPSPAISITVAGADHMDWVDDPSCGFCGFCTAGTAAPEVARKASRRLDVAWLKRRLLDDTSMDAWLDLADPALTITKK